MLLRRTRSAPRQRRNRIQASAASSSAARFRWWRPTPHRYSRPNHPACRRAGRAVPRPSPGDDACPIVDGHPGSAAAGLRELSHGGYSCTTEFTMKSVRLRDSVRRFACTIGYWRNNTSMTSTAAGSRIRLGGRCSCPPALTPPPCTSVAPPRTTPYARATWAGWCPAPWTQASTPLPAPDWPTARRAVRTCRGRNEPPADR